MLTGETLKGLNKSRENKQTNNEVNNWQHKLRQLKTEKYVFLK